jgi:hypothetical protein
MMTMITPEERRTVLAIVVVLVVIGLAFHKVETLVAGLLGLLAGIIAYVGALRAADRQVTATQQAAAKQVVAMQSQLDDARAAREESDRRRLSVVKWAVRAEGKRLGTAAALMMREALPSAPQPATRSREQLTISSSSLLRGEREDIALLDDETRERLQEIADTLDAYNLRIAAARVGIDGPLIDQRALELIAQVEKLAAELREVRADG